MKPIHDIRLFKGDSTAYLKFSDKKYYAVPHRIAMKLCELGYSLGDFDHLYVNFTVNEVENGMGLSKRPVDPFHPWYRYYDIQVSEALFDTLEIPESYDAILSLIEAALIRISPKDEELVRRAVAEAVEQSENMLVLRKQKVTSTRRATVYLRYTDDLYYFPLLRVFNREDDLLFETDLPKTVDLLILGDIQVSRNHVTVKPRKNVHAESQGLQPLMFQY